MKLEICMFTNKKVGKVSLISLTHSLTHSLTLKLKRIFFSFKKAFGVLALLFLFFFILPTTASAATYYVSKTGNDTTGDGSSGNPWLTLQKAENTASNGDTVNVSAGTYAETNYWSLAKAITWNATGEVIVRGTSTSIRVINFTGTGATILNGFTLDSEGTRSTNVWINSGAANKTLNNMTFMAATGNMINNVAGSDITVSNSTFELSAAGNKAINISSGAGDMTISGNTFNFSTTITGILQQSSTVGALSVTGNTVNGTSSGNLFYITSGGNVDFSNNNITMSASTASLLLTSGGSGTFDLKNNVVNFTKTTNEAFFFSAGTWTLDIDGNEVTSTATDMVYAIFSLQDQYSPLIQNNTIDTLATADRGQIFIRSTGTDGGALHITDNTLQSRSDLFVINIGTDTPGAGSTKLNGAIIENNTIYGPIYYDSGATSSGTHGIFYSQNVNGVIRNNTIIGVGFGVVIKGTGESYTSGGVYYNKIINSNVTSSIRIKGVKDVPVYNNSVWSDSSLTARLVYSTDNLGGDDGTGTVLKNNIFYGSNAQGITIQDGSQTDFASDYNVFYRDSGTRIGSIASTDYDSLSTWQTAGYDTHGLFSNPLLTDTGTYNLVPLYNSPVIDSGTTISGLTQDILGNNIYGTPDIGAYEYQPPYTIGSNELDIGGDVRIYADGKFRNTQTPSESTADLSVTPVGGFGVGDYSEWMNVDISTWNTSGDYSKTWTESSNSIGSDSTVHTVGDLAAGSQYVLKVDDVQGADITSSDCIDGLCTADSSGEIEFTYTGGYSTVSFDISEYVAPTPVPAQSTHSPADAPVCRDTAPVSAPWLYSAVTQNSNSIMLYFTDATDPVDKYVLEFGTSSGSYQYGADNIGGKGARTYLVQSLQPNTTYYFRVRGGNGCATGAWSNEISAKTKGAISLSQLQTTNVELEPVTSTEESKSVPNGSSEQEPNEEVLPQEGYAVNIRVTDSDNNPVAGAKVTIHSKFQEANTDENGIARFENVEPGEHRVLIAYSGYEGEQSINLTGDVKEFNLNITVEQKPFSLSPLAYVIIVVLGLVIFVLVVLLIRLKRKER